MVASSERPSASRKSGKSSGGASLSRHALSDSPRSPKATVSAPQAKNFHAAEGGGPLRAAQPFLDGFGRSFYVAASASHGHSIGKVSDIKLILRFCINYETAYPKLGCCWQHPKLQTVRRYLITTR